MTKIASIFKHDIDVCQHWFHNRPYHQQPNPHLFSAETKYIETT